MPAKSEKQRRYMAAELQRRREGKPAETTLTKTQLKHYAEKKRKKRQ